MKNEIAFINHNHVVLRIRDHCVNVRTDDGTALKLADELLAPFSHHNFGTKSEYIKALTNSEEDTVIVNKEDLVRRDAFGTILTLGIVAVVVLTVAYGINGMIQLSAIDVTTTLGF